MSKMKWIFFIVLFLSFTVSSQVKTSTEDWKQYNSPMAGFNVKYPSDWKIYEEEASGKVWQIMFASPRVKDDDISVASSITICSKPRGSSFNNWGSCRQKDDHLSRKDTVVSEKTYELNGLKIQKKETEDDYRPNASYLYAFFSTKDRDFLISSSFPRRFGLDKNIPVFDQMLSTFQPTKEVSVTVYRNDKYDFALTYPKTWKTCPLDEINYNSDEEPLLRIAPTNESCLGNNFIFVSRMSKLSNEKNNLELKSFLGDKDYTKIVPYLEFGNIHSALGEKAEKQTVRRDRYFYTNYPQTYELLKMSEMFETNQDIYKREAEDILKTARRFLKNQWYDTKN